MKELLKKIDWNKVKQISIRLFIMAILNTALWVYLIGSFVPYASFGEFKLSWIDYLRLSDKVEFWQIWLLYIGIAVGILLTVLFIKWWAEASRKERQHKELIATQSENNKMLVEAITKAQQKKLEKEDKEVKKYLGE